MIITVLNLEKLKNNYKVLFSNNFEIKCNEELVLKYRLVKGKELDDTLIESIIEDSIWYDYYDKALNYLSRGLKSINRIKEYLINKGALNEHVNKVIEELVSKNILNDKIYFERLSQYYLNQGYGPNYIKNKGYKERIETDIINEVILNLDNELILDNARRLKNKKDNLLKNDNLKNEKIKKYLLNRGFSYDSILTIFNET